MLRQLMAHQLDHFGGPQFVTDRVMAPFTLSVPYMSWSIERDWIGAYFWKWNPDFPFLWFYFGVSLVATYAGVGYILRRMGLSSRSAWMVALAAVVFHVPRHFKIWHHYEHLLQHWVYWGLFVDAWIWQRLWRDNKWAWNLEFWRGLCLIGVLGTAGYFWGPMILAWVVVRLAMVGLVAWRQRKPELEGSLKKILLPVGLGIALLIVDLRWYLPLFSEVKKLGEVPQVMSWFAEAWQVVRPLWAEPFKLPIAFSQHIDAPETVVSIGWFYWVLALVAGFQLIRKKGLDALVLWAPFLVVVVTGVLYMSTGAPDYAFQKFIQETVPFMKFFRVASRWGLFLPELVAILIVLAWPELSAWACETFERRNKMVHGALILFGLMTAGELTWLFYPVNMMPPMSKGLESMLHKIRETPGTTVLNLPFCVTGGNGVCAAEQCPNYPYSTAPMCFTQWHEKKVYGLYASRLMFSDCELYHRQPYLSWFDAWKTQRCFTENEWTEFCHYLDEHTELSAVMVYPEIWQGARNAECRAQFDRHLGSPIDEKAFYLSPTRGGRPSYSSRVLWYSPRCRS